MLCAGCVAGSWLGAGSAIAESPIHSLQPRVRRAEFTARHAGDSRVVRGLLRRPLLSEALEVDNRPTPLRGKCVGGTSWKLKKKGVPTFRSLRLRPVCWPLSLVISIDQNNTILLKSGQFAARLGGRANSRNAIVPTRRFMKRESTQASGMEALEPPGVGESSKPLNCTVGLLKTPVLQIGGGGSSGRCQFDPGHWESCAVTFPFKFDPFVTFTQYSHPPTVLEMRAGIVMGP